MKTRVRLREANKMIDVNITSENKPNISENILKKWQKVIDNVADIFEVPSALIMKITIDHMEVFLKSGNKENPYPPDGKDTLGHGLYCETVIATQKELLVENALEDKVWEANPDVKLDMISYLGLPINWADGETFGTICVLDSKTNAYSDKYKKFLELMKRIIEDDLELLLINQKLIELSIKDELTGIYNRRYVMNFLEELEAEYARYKRPFSIIMLDLNGFKKINDEYGHIKGDEVLKQFAQVIKQNIREVDIIARLGGDEFMVVCKETNEKDIIQVEAKILDVIKHDKLLQTYNLTVSEGAATYHDDTDIDGLFIEADNNMYDHKKK